MTPSRKLVLLVVDGLTPAMLESAIDRGEAPALAFLADHGRYGRATSVFPSLTPVCLSSIATGAYPDVHRIPHLVWYHRGERRLVEYGSSFAAILAAGMQRSLRDTILNMNQQHLGADAVTVYEALEDAGLTAGAINITCYRGRHRHAATLPGVPPAFGPSCFFFYNLFESERTGAPLSVRRRSAGTVDGYAAAVARWLVTRDGFDFLLLYLSDVDYASHALGPDAAHEALARTDRALGAVMDAAGGWDEFLDRYAVLLASDHGQTRVERAARLQDAFADLQLARRAYGDGELAVTASNRAGMVYRLDGCRHDARELAARLDGDEAVDVTLFLEEGEAIARRDGEELRFAPDGDGWRTSGDTALLDHPNALERAWRALANPNAGDLLVSPVEGVEFVDGGGGHHLGGGSHGSLVAGDSEVPVLAVGLERLPASIVDIAPLVLDHFGVARPPYARREPVRAA